ncbi:MAG: EamA family transporter RarD [Myxococcota bacterium]
MGGGVGAALAAYGLWGVLALYWKQLSHVSAAEILAYRILFGALGAGLIVVVVRGGPRVAAVWFDPRQRRAAVLATALIGINWFLFIWAVSEHRVTQVSLGYYINPLVNVALGALVLGERLSGLRKLAVGLAATGVLAFVVNLGYLPWLSLVLALSFGGYGVVRKQAKAGPLEGLFLETALLAPLALLYLLQVGAVALFEGGWTTAFLVGGGPVTIVPLLLFAYAARRIPYGTLGMLQYLAPTLQLACAVWAFDEPFTPAHALTFAFVWCGLFVYAVEGLRARGVAEVDPAPREP